MTRLSVHLKPVHGEGPLTEALPLALRELAAPVVAAGLDWLRFRDGSDPGLVPGEAPSAGRGSRPGGDPIAWAYWMDGELFIELRAPTDGAARGRTLWQGRVGTDDLARIALRAAASLRGVDLWPCEAEWPGAKVCLAIEHDSGAPTPENPRRLDPEAGASALGIEWGEPAQATPLPSVSPGDVIGEPALTSTDDPELEIVLRPRVFEEIQRVRAESGLAGEERALVLLGRRYRLLGAGAPVPLFEIEACEEPELVEASAAGLVLARDSLVRRSEEGRTAVGLLHTHLPPCGLTPSDSDLRDLDDLNQGGPGFLSMIFLAVEEARREPPTCVVLARLGSREGRCVCASARIRVGRLQAASAIDRDTPDPIAQT